MTAPGTTIDSGERTRRGFGDPPTSVTEAAAQLDRISRHCVYNCDRAGGCVEGECDAWQLGQAAADYLVTHWATAEG